jgi:hypothetical protein
MATQSFPDCIIATRGYDFREGQEAISTKDIDVCDFDLAGRSKTYLSAPNPCEPLSGSPACAVLDSAASSFTLAQIGPNGPSKCCSAGKPSA